MAGAPASVNVVHRKIEAVVRVLEHVAELGGRLGEGSQAPASWARTTSISAGVMLGRWMVIRASR
jgi:hypothetical protein